MTLRWLKIPALSWLLAAPALAQDSTPPSPEPTPMSTPAPSRSPAPMIASEAPAAAAAFGAQGQLAISVDLPLNNEAPELTFVHSSTSMGGGTSNTVAIQPSFDYFVAPDLSVGGLVGFAYSTVPGMAGNPSLNITLFDVELRVGYNVPLGEMASLWPRVGIMYTHSSTSSGGASGSGYSIPLTAFIPVLWQPVHHFFLGAGPFVTTELVNKLEGLSQPKTTQYGLQALIGGYFGG
jgi:hypothetical protein